MKPTGQSYELRCGHDTERFHYVFRNEYGEPSDGCRACDGKSPSAAAGPTVTESLTDWCEAIDEKHRQWMKLGLIDRGVPEQLAERIVARQCPIPVTERLPEFTGLDPDDGMRWSDEVLALTPAKGRFSGWIVCEYWNDGLWFNVELGDDEKSQPTHWLPLPPKPE